MYLYCSVCSTLFRHRAIHTFLNLLPCMGTRPKIFFLLIPLRLQGVSRMYESWANWCWTFIPIFAVFYFFFFHFTCEPPKFFFLAWAKLTSVFSHRVDVLSRFTLSPRENKYYIRGWEKKTVCLTPFLRAHTLLPCVGIFYVYINTTKISL